MATLVIPLRRFNGNQKPEERSVGPGYFRIFNGANSRPGFLHINKFCGIRVKTEGEQTATFGVFATIGIGHQTINQGADPAALDPAHGSVWRLLNEFRVALTVMSK